MQEREKDKILKRERGKRGRKEERERENIL